MEMLNSNGDVKTHSAWNTFHVIPDDEEGPLHGCASYEDQLACGDSPLQYLYPGRLMKNWYYYDWSNIPPETPPNNIPEPNFNLYDQPIPPVPKEEKNTSLKRNANISPSEPEYGLEYPEEVIANPREFFQDSKNSSKIPVWLWFIIGGIVALFIILMIWISAKMEQNNSPPQHQGRKRISRVYTQGPIYDGYLTD